jgi:hypothetical protein
MKESRNITLIKRYYYSNMTHHNQGKSSEKSNHRSTFSLVILVLSVIWTEAKTKHKGNLILKWQFNQKLRQIKIIRAFPKPVVQNILHFYQLPLYKLFDTS